MNPFVPLGMSAFVAAVACGRPDWTPPTLKSPPVTAGTSGAATSRHAPTAGTPLGPSVVSVDFSQGVSVAIQLSDAGTAASGSATSPITFALPLARGVAPNVGAIEVRVDGRKVAGVRMRPLLTETSSLAGPSLRSVWIELPRVAVRLPGVVEIRFGARERGASASPNGDAKASANGERASTVSFTASSRPAKATVNTATYGVEARGTSTFAAVPRGASDKTLFEGVLPLVLPTFPAGYLAKTQLFGDLVTEAEVARSAELGSGRWLSEAFVRFADGAMGETGYPLHPSAVGLQTEAWLYDRCATYLLAHAHTGALRHLRHGLITCSSYARAIGKEGERRGIFAGKTDRDTKYSHVRGLYLYYALTGDEVALEAGRAMAEMWGDDPLFAKPYRDGAARGPDKLWTERLLAASIEGGVYGFLLTGEARFLDNARTLTKTALRHITTQDAAALRAITLTPFPPQSCFVHNALQQAEGNADVPWCSSWMSELVIDPLLRMQEVTGEDVDEVFVRLARSMRDAGTTYFQDNPINDSFLAPAPPRDREEPRVLTPLYGYGISADGKRVPSGEWSDFEHCPDATAITAVALRALRRSGAWDKKPIPASAAYRADLSRFASEGESILSLHRELTFCAQKTFERARREKRDPRAAPQDLLARAYGAGDAKAQAKALEDNKIGWPVYDATPSRKLSWWFNTSIAQLAWLRDAKVRMSAP